MVDYLIRKHYTACSRPLRRCHARDLLEQIQHYCEYNELHPTVNEQHLDYAVRNYFTALQDEQTIRQQSARTPDGANRSEPDAGSHALRVEPTSRLRESSSAGSSLDESRRIDRLDERNESVEGEVTNRTMIGHDDHFQAALGRECFVDLGKGRVVCDRDGSWSSAGLSVDLVVPLAAASAAVSGEATPTNRPFFDRQTARRARRCGAERPASPDCLHCRSSTNGNGSMMSCAITLANGLPPVSSFLPGVDLLRISVLLHGTVAARLSGDRERLLPLFQKLVPGSTPICHGTIAVDNDNRASGWRSV